MENGQELRKLKQLAGVFAETAMDEFSKVPLAAGMNGVAIVYMGVNSLYQFPDEEQGLEAMQAVFGNEIDEATAFIFTQARDVQGPIFRADAMKRESEGREPESLAEANIPMAEIYARIAMGLAGVDNAADLLPTQARSREISGGFEKAGAPALAQLCSVPIGPSMHRTKKHNLH